MAKPTKSDMMRRIRLNNDLHRLANQCADDCQRWANEYLHAAQHWRNEAKHAAKNMHALVIQLQGARDV